LQNQNTLTSAAKTIDDTYTITLLSCDAPLSEISTITSYSTVANGIVVVAAVVGVVVVEGVVVVVVVVVVVGVVGVVVVVVAVGVVEVVVVGAVVVVVVVVVVLLVLAVLVVVGDTVEEPAGVTVALGGSTYNTALSGVVGHSTASGASIVKDETLIFVIPSLTSQPW